MPRAQGAGREGSPPLARGTALALLHRHLRDGITPACAGNSTPPYTGIRPLWDHPRLRGEQFPRQPRDKLFKGSPPLARGTGERILNRW